MNASTSRIARTLLLAALASAVAVGCSKKVKETPPADTGASTGTTTTAPIDDTPRAGAYGPGDLDTDAQHHQSQRRESQCAPAGKQLHRTRRQHEIRQQVLYLVTVVGQGW